ncbi:MAG: hypothetical protein V3R96_06000 [Dehalococcoidales bacterium]
MPYLVELEKAGIPTVLMNYTEETEAIKQHAVIHGLPKQRFVEASRNSLGGVDEADKVLPLLMESLTRPLTEEEKESGRWEPKEPRILFEGTLDEAEEFYQQDENIPGLLDSPFATYTDGMPIVIPTEEMVREMLAGTSHRPDELITIQRDGEETTGTRRRPRKKGDVVVFQPMFRTATVEQVAVNAVMAGCKPEYFPMVLAIAESGAGGARGNGGGYIVSGPIYKEIGMNVSYGRFGPGNRPNKTIGRVGSLLWRNLGGFKDTVTGISVTRTYTSPLTNGGLIFAEYAEGLPDGWKGLNEEFGFKKDESILMTFSPSVWGLGQEHMPGVYRSLQRTGHGAIARYLDVKGIPGPHNYLEFLTKDIWACRESGFTLVMTPQIAQDMYDYGFKTKDEIYEWIFNRSFEPLKDYRMRGRPDEHTNGWMGIEKTSGKHWKELPDDYMVAAGGNGPWEYNIIVCDGQETNCDRFGGGHGQAYSIDAWR